MKKALVLLLFLMGTAGLYAQQAGQFTVGGRLGWAIGFNNPEGFGDFLKPDMIFLPSGVPPDSVSDGQRITFNFAVYWNYAITDSIAIQVEFNFMTRQGYELRFSAPGYRSRLVSVNYSSLDIPILFRYNFSNSRAAFGIQAGPHVSIPMGRVEVYENRWYRWSLHATEFNEQFAIDTRASFGLTAGLFAGFPFPLFWRTERLGRFVIDTRFIFDFNSLNAYDSGRSIEFITRRAFSFTVGYERSF